MQRKIFGAIILLSISFFSCQKINFWQDADGNPHGHLKQTKTFSSDVVIKWTEMQVKLMMANPTATGNAAFSRHYAYTGVALYEAVVGGMPSYKTLSRRLNGLTGLPQNQPGYAYHWAASANAALAEMNRKLFPTASDANKELITKLEDSLNAVFAASSDETTMQRSVSFGKEIAQKIFEWSETDGYQHANDPYTAPADKVGPAFWAPPATPSIQSLPYWGKLRRMVPGSGNGADLPAPPAYSTASGSEFHNMVSEVYNATPAMGSPERAMAFHWRDVPGTTTPGHYVSILKQVLEMEKPSLDLAAVAYAMGGIMVFDASISTWKTKYDYLLVRPIVYIQNVLGHTTWTSTLGTPPHPEYPSAHSSLSAANAEAMTLVFGENFAFEDHTFDYLYNPAVDPLMFKYRSYPSFSAAASEAGVSRMYAGIHYMKSIEMGLLQGKKVADNIRKSLMK